jgi:hypothetical protein
MRKLDSGVVLFEQDDWGPRQKLMGNQISRAVDEVIVHHSYLPNIPCGNTVEREIASMKSMDRFHSVDNNWGGFSYNLAGYQSGHVYIGRGLFRTGAHTAGKNSTTLGYVFVTDGSTNSLTDAAIAGFKAAMAMAIRGGALSARYTISPHDKYKNKVCPGARIKAQLSQLLATVTKSWPTLRLGDRGEAVTYLQNWLIQAGFMASGHPFGYFGAITEVAVRRAQTAHSLVADGIVGPATWNIVP